MPKVTGRFYTFLIVAFLMYLFANQTQVSWLYVTSALIAGVIPVAWLFNRGMLHNLTGERTIGEGDAFQEIHETDEIDIALKLRAKRRAAPQIDMTEMCPLVPPEDEQYSHNVFVPMLPAGNAVTLDYAVTVYQRGLYTFPDVTLKTRAPFGLFQKQGMLNVDTSVLVYPEVRKLQSLDFLDRQPAAQITHNKAGLGSEVIGVRPYRTGDSPRHIHWRSVARIGRLVSKEFAEETQPGISIVIDRTLTENQHPKHNPFEWGIKAAVSIAEYAQRRHYPVHLHAVDDGFTAPRGAITWDAMMQYTARLSSSHDPFVDVLEAGGFRQYVAVVVSQASENLLTPIVGLKYSGANVLVVIPDASSFPAVGQHNTLADALRAESIDVVELTYGEDWAEQLSAYRSRL